MHGPLEDNLAPLKPTGLELLDRSTIALVRTERREAFYLVLLGAALFAFTWLLLYLFAYHLHSRSPLRPHRVLAFRSRLWCAAHRRGRHVSGWLVPVGRQLPPTISRSNLELSHCPISSEKGGRCSTRGVTGGLRGVEHCPCEATGVGERSVPRHSGLSVQATFTSGLA